MELKLRSLPVSGTKIDLIERLKAYRENAAENPVSPVASKVSSLALEDGLSGDSPSKPPGAATPPACENPAAQDYVPVEEGDSDKDKRLYEKERQIEELLRKLEQEQRLVEELKMQLEVEKRSQQGDSPPLLQVKEETATPPLSSCSASSSPLHLVAAVKKEEGVDGCGSSPPGRFVFANEIEEVQARAHVLLPASLPVPPLVQPSQKIEASVASQPLCSVQPLSKVRKRTHTYIYIHIFLERFCSVCNSTPYCCILPTFWHLNYEAFRTEVINLIQIVLHQRRSA